jgi:hypothetical protein
MMRNLIGLGAVLLRETAVAGSCVSETVSFKSPECLRLFSHFTRSNTEVATLKKPRPHPQRSNSTAVTGRAIPSDRQDRQDRAIIAGACAVSQ